MYRAYWGLLQECGMMKSAQIHITPIILQMFYIKSLADQINLTLQVNLMCAYLFYPNIAVTIWDCEMMSREPFLSHSQFSDFISAGVSDKVPAGLLVKRQYLPSFSFPP